MTTITRTYGYDLLDVLDQEMPYPEWMEADLYGDRDYDEEPYNGSLIDDELST